MHRVTLIAVLTFALTSVACSPQPKPVALDLQCPGPDDPHEKEAAFLRAAPHGANRTGHQFEVAWSGGKRTFADEPPYDREVGNVYWLYCGYTPKLKLHLIFHATGGTFTGSLLDDVTGSLLPGGQRVLVSPDEQHYLAYEMADGKWTETLKLYRRNGTLAWQGDNGFMPGGQGTAWEFKDLHWTPENTLQTVAKPSEGSNEFVTTLAPRNNEWIWSHQP